MNFAGYCLEDSPTGVRFTDHASAFPAGLNAAMTFDRDIVYRRGVAMGEEYRGKGVNIALGPMMNMVSEMQHISSGTERYGEMEEKENR